MDELGNDITLATPLGLGKPNVLLNDLYERAKRNPELQLKVFTALSLNPPHLRGPDLARRFFEPFFGRQWGDDYPSLKYAKDSEANRLPKNVQVFEFYFTAGVALQSPELQRAYQCINYTRVTEAIAQKKVRMVVQLIAQDLSTDVPRYSLSSNPDVTLDLVDLYRKRGLPLLVVGVIHPDLPFLGGDAEVNASFFDILVNSPEINHQLFALPRSPITDADHAIGFYASQLVADNGTLQIGIGSLSDAVVSSILLRHQQASFYSSLVDASWEGRTSSTDLNLEREPFSHGIYGLSEMVTDGYMHMREAGILKRYVIDEKSGSKTYLHGAFFLGSKVFYSWLKSLKGDDFSGIRMTRVSKVNDLYDPNELLLRRQRKNPRFLNTCMRVSVLGGAASDTLDDGRVVSGVGGQYNFVAMSQELEDSRSVLMLRSVREVKKKPSSNIVWSSGNLTIPRHLRDIVITEYGIADLRGKTDEECIAAMISITDSRFQAGLVKTAKKNGKLAPDYKIPGWARNNSPEKIRRFIQKGKNKGAFSRFPLGSDFTPEEENLITALERIRDLSLASKLYWIICGFAVNSTPFKLELKRMSLEVPKSLIEILEQRLLLTALNKSDVPLAY